MSLGDLLPTWSTSTRNVYLLQTQKRHRVYPAWRLGLDLATFTNSIGLSIVENAGKLHPKKLYYASKSFRNLHVKPVRKRIRRAVDFEISI